MWLLVNLACWNSKIDALKEELVALEEEIDELEDQVNAPDDTGAPDDSAPSEDSDAPPRRAPAAYYEYDITGSSGSYDMKLGAVVEGDFDYTRIQLWTVAGFEVVEDACLIFDENVTSNYFDLAIEAWSDGEYFCWTFLSTSHEVYSCPWPLRVDTITCE
jgi:hypothetical protein